jgi:hypothetical protein
MLKIALPDGSGSRLRRLRKDVLDRLRGTPARLRLIFAHSKEFQINLARRARRVVFVSDVPSQREAKIAYGLKRAGWDVIQLYRAKNVLTDFSSIAEAREFHSTWDAVDLAHRAECRVFHNFAYSGDETSVRLTDNKPGRVIFDFYDYLFSMVDGLPPEQAMARRADVERQAYCIEKADAICCRDLQLQYRRKDTRLARGKPVILFPEYCWNSQPAPESDRDEKIRLVQVGTMGMETIDQDDIGSYRIFERLVEAGCYLDIYLHPYFPPEGTPAFEKLFRDYVALQARTGLVHFHPPVSPQKLGAEIARYDFGAGVTNGLSFDVPSAGHNLARLAFCGSSRMYDYLDAGLGMLIHRQLRFLWKSFQPYGVARDATELLRAPNLKSAFGQKPAPDVIARARRDLSIDRNISRLTNFYEKLI